MKRSKIFLGITTAILAIAGVTAAKHYGPTVTRFYVTSNGYCGQISSLCTKGTLTACQYTSSGGTSFNVFTKGPAGTKTSANCISQLKYNNVEN